MYMYYKYDMTLATVGCFSVAKNSRQFESSPKFGRKL